MKDLVLKKDKTGIIRIIGEFTYFQQRSKYIDIDGERYHKEHVVEITTNLKNMDESNKEIYEYDFSALKQTLKVEDRVFMSGFNGSLFKYGAIKGCTSNGSENDYANRAMNLFEAGLCPPEVIDIFVGRDRDQMAYGNTFDKIKAILSGRGICIPLAYFSGFYLFYTISLKTLFYKVEFEHIPSEIIKLFEYHDISLKDKNRMNFSNIKKLINLKIRTHETSKQ